MSLKITLEVYPLRRLGTITPKEGKIYAFICWIMKKDIYLLQA